MTRHDDGRMVRADPPDRGRAGEPVLPTDREHLEKVARGTPMFSGADLAAIINEAAIAARGPAYLREKIFGEDPKLAELVKDRAVSVSDYDQAATETEVAEATLKAAEAQVPTGGSWAGTAELDAAGARVDAYMQDVCGIDVGSTDTSGTTEDSSTMPDTSGLDPSMFEGLADNPAALASVFASMGIDATARAQATSNCSRKGA